MFKKNNDNVKQSRSANSVRGVQRSSDCNGDTNLNRKVSNNTPKSVIHASERTLQSDECTSARVEIPASPSQEACLQHTQEKWVTNRTAARWATSLALASAEHVRCAHSKRGHGSVCNLEECALTLAMRDPSRRWTPRTLTPANGPLFGWCLSVLILILSAMEC